MEKNHYNSIQKYVRTMTHKNIDCYIKLIVLF